VQFEWDDIKNERNIANHGIDFADVEAVFDNLLLTNLDERFDYGEDRWVSIGMLGPGYVVVIWTERDAAIIRIISARRANKDERQRYETHLANQLGAASSGG
jgi:uncharacterized DUF497 family protein